MIIGCLPKLMSSIELKQTFNAVWSLGKILVEEFLVMSLYWLIMKLHDKELQMFLSLFNKSLPLLVEIFLSTDTWPVSSCIWPLFSYCVYYFYFSTRRKTTDIIFYYNLKFLFKTKISESVLTYQTFRSYLSYLDVKVHGNNK